MRFLPQGFGETLPVTQGVLTAAKLRLQRPSAAPCGALTVTWPSWRTGVSSQLAEQQVALGRLPTDQEMAGAHGKQALVASPCADQVLGRSQEPAPSLRAGGGGLCTHLVHVKSLQYFNGSGQNPRINPTNGKTPEKEWQFLVVSRTKTYASSLVLCLCVVRQSQEVTEQTEFLPFKKIYSEHCLLCAVFYTTNLRSHSHPSEVPQKAV